MGTSTGRRIAWIMVSLAIAASPGFSWADEGKGPPPLTDPSGPERPGPWLLMWQRIAVAGWPAGLLGETRIQPRVALHRAESMVFNNTFAGAGGRVRITPAFVDVGPRLSLSPIDLFEVNAQASFVYYWPSSSGLLPYWDLGDSTRDLDREDRFDDPATRPEASHALFVTLDPTLQLMFWRIAAFSSWTFAWFWIDRPEGIDSPLVYEPFYDRLVEWDDLIIEHQSAVLGIFSEEKPKLWIGATIRQRWVIGSGDVSWNVGGVVMLRPGVKPGWPTFIAMVLPYIKDADRVGGAPNVNVLLTWGHDYTMSDLRGVR